MITTLDAAIKQIDDFHIPPEARLKAAEFLKQHSKPDLDTVCEIDLHCHSFYSDGYCSPAMRVFEAWRRKLKAIAISDHDLFDGQIEAIRAAAIFDIELIPAIEFYTDRAGIEIIGHFPDIDKFITLIESGRPDQIIEPIRHAKRRQLDSMLKRIPTCFAALNFEAEINSNDIDRYLRNGISTKGDISVAMWQKYGSELLEAGLANDVKEFQALYTTKDSMLNLPLEIDLDMSAGAFVKRILDWGGLPGLAHPSELRKKEGLGNAALRDAIEQLAAVGLQTIEVDGWRNGVCPETGLNQTDLFNQMRLDYNSAHHDKLPLLFTNGSDDHNQPGEGLALGCGRNGNLRPEFGRYANIIKLKRRQSELARKFHKIS